MRTIHNHRVGVNGIPFAMGEISVYHQSPDITNRKGVYCAK